MPLLPRPQFPRFVQNSMAHYYKYGGSECLTVRIVKHTPERTQVELPDGRRVYVKDENLWMPHGKPLKP